jgi:hypothetical protein
MIVDVRPEILIRRSRPEVAAYMFDPAHEKVWTTGVVESRPLTPGRFKPGSRVERITRFLGCQFGYQYEVVAAQGDDFVELKVEKPFPMHVRYKLEDAPGGTLARIHARGDASGFFSLAGPLLNRMVHKNISKDLEKLKHALESDTTP